jgi:hypothetical protein
VEEELFVAIIIIITLYSRPRASSQVSKATVVAFDRWKVSLPKHRIVYKWMRRRRVIIIPGCWKQGIEFSGLWRNQTGVAATASPHALDCVSFSNTATECTSVEPPRLATIQAQYKMFLEPCAIKN